MSEANVSQSMRNIKPFDGENFADWKLRVELVLDEQGLLEIVKDEPNENNAKWMKNNKKCKAIITQYLSDKKLEYVRENKTAHEVWAALINAYERKGSCSKRLLLKEIMELKYSGNSRQELEEHFVSFEKIMRGLRNAGTKLDESDFCCFLLNTLP